MPQRTPSRRMYTRLVLFSLAGFALWALGRNRPDPQGRVPETTVDVHGAYANDVEKTRARERTSYSKRRLATSLTFATLFFAGAALSAGAGDTVAEMVEGTDAPAAAETTTAEAPAEEAPPAEAPPAPEAPAEEPAEAPAEEPAEQPAEEPAEAPADEPAEGGSEGEEAPADDPGPAEEGGEPAEGSEEPAEEEEPAPAPKDDEPAESSDAGDEAAAEEAPELPATAPEETSHELEFESGFATIWLHRTLPDPTPLAKRLTPRFARQLKLTAKRFDVDWAYLLGVLRAQRHLDRAPATQSELNRLSRQLASALRSSNAWQAALAMSGRAGFADRTMTWTQYHRAVGLRALVSGLAAAKSTLEDRVLFDPRIDMYAGGASDVESGRIDVRVLVLLRYMAEAHGQVTVSSLKSGHGFFSRPGVPSAHMYGLAVDISALDGRSIMGNQAPGGLTERAVRNILLLPRELRPKQVISLLGLGGPSFPLEDHHDHIHVGY
jgi:hypothetical protein